MAPSASFRMCLTANWCRGCAARAKDNESVALETLRPPVEETARLWGCTVELVIDPNSAVFPRITVNQLSLMLAEAVANAVRHGEATTVRVTVSCEGSLLTIE